MEKEREIARDTSVDGLEYRNNQESEKPGTPVLAPVSYYPWFAIRSP